MFAAKNELLTRPSGGYNLTRSLRFRSSASAYLNRTLTTPTNNLKWTFSAWIKRGAVADTTIFSQGIGATNTYAHLYYSSTGELNFRQVNGSGTVVAAKTTSALYRDYSAWYHVVLVYDSANATSTNRLLMYVNGVQVTSFSVSTDPSLNLASYINSALEHRISSVQYSPVLYYYDGYLAEVNFIDGQALAPTAFGTFNSYGVWQPITYGGSYGTNGFRLPFTNNASTTTLGYDFSPNGNNWTTNNISVTSGVTYDSMTDVPTLTSATAANFAVLNPLAFNAAYISDGNLLFAGPNLTSVRGTVLVSGLCYFELTPTTTMPNYVSLGLAEKSTLGNAATGAANTWGLYPTATMYTWSGATSINTGVTTPALGCTFALAYDATTGKLWLGYAASGAGSITWVGGGSPAAGTSPTYTLSTSLELFPFVSSNNSTADKSAINFGQRPFTYTPPTGFLALNTFNL